MLCGQCAGWVLTLTVIVGCFNTYQHVVLSRGINALSSKER